MAKTKNRRKKRQTKRYSPSSLTHKVTTIRRVPAPADIDVSAAWYLVRTNPTKEHRAEIGLRAKGYKTFLPMVAYQAPRRGRMVDFEKPLFPGYLLISLAGLSWYPIRRVDGVHSIVVNNLKPVQVPEKAVKEIVRLSTESQEIIAPEPMPMLDAGEQAVVCDGPFSSFIATVVELLPHGRAQVLVNIFGSECKTELDLVQLRAASGY